jgi:transketolase
MRVLEQIRLDVCYDPLPVVFLGDGAGLVYSTLGASHQCTEDVSALRPLGGLSILSPADAAELRGCFALARASTGPTYLRIGRADRGNVHPLPPRMDWGRVHPLAGPGRVAILATGSMVRTALDIAQRLPGLAVWSVPSIEPIDQGAVLDIARSHEALVTMEEHDIRGGLGSVVAELTAEHHPVRVVRIGTDRRYSQTAGSWEHLLREHGLDTESVCRRVAAVLESSTRNTHPPS